MNKQFSQASKKRLQQVKQIDMAHLDFGMRMLHAYKGAMYGLDLFGAGAIKRSMAHCSGFRKLILDRNFVCAASILRLQLDNALRFYAAYIGENPHKFAVAVLGGEHVRILKDKEGKSMTDKYLVSCHRSREVIQS